MSTPRTDAKREQIRNHILGMPKDYSIQYEARELTRYAEQLERELAAANKRAESAEAMHRELIMGVGNKYPDETRHQTALRYILNTENRQNTLDAGAAKSDAARGKA